MWMIDYLWVIAVLPLLAAGALAVTRRPYRGLAASLAIGSMAVALVLSVAAFGETFGPAFHSAGGRLVRTFTWCRVGQESLLLGWVLDPLTAVMLVMVSLVGLLIFIYSVGYMAHDENFTRFFCFLALFAAAMLGLVLANSLLLLFICWELVGFASYILIGFWHHRPSAAAAAKKAFVTTRLGDIGFFIGMLWLFRETGTLVFYDGAGGGCLEASAVSRLAAQTTLIGLTVSAAIALLIFCGAVGKSGQVPLHVWLPDAMEGPTPVSALIHAATMVAAGVFLVARMYPLMAATASGVTSVSAALQVVTWVGAVTAVFAACIAVAQTDIKRILAYSTVSQLGFMMLGLGVGGVAVGMFHLITHAFFKALLFMGAGSVIHGVHSEQDIRRMGGLRKFLPVTFVTYAIGMMALAGVPVFFAGFWSKDAILHAAHRFPGSSGPFYLGLVGAFLTAFYMTRQVSFIFFGRYRGGPSRQTAQAPASDGEAAGHTAHGAPPQESPAVMTTPLVLLAACAMLLGFLGTPAWPGFQRYVSGQPAPGGWHELFSSESLFLMLLSTVVVLAGIGLAWWLYGRKPAAQAEDLDPLERLHARGFGVLRNKFFVDEFYEATVVRLNARWAWLSDAFDRWIWGGLVQFTAYVMLGLSWVSRFVDEYVVNLGFDAGCRSLKRGAGATSRLQDGQVQGYLRVIGVGLTVLLLLLTWGCSQ
jgi:NADH-quinone oxidoreductase subunit L